MANGDQDTSSAGWMSDVQRALALIIIGMLVFATAAMVLRLVWSASVDDVTDMAKIMLAALVNMGLIALGFFFGNTSAKVQSDAGQQKVVEKLTSTQPPNGGPVAPLPAPAVVAWWGKLTDDEKNAITAASAGDPRVAAFITASTVGAASADDLGYLVSKDLLTQDRATAIQA